MTVAALIHFWVLVDHTQPTPLQSTPDTGMTNGLHMEHKFACQCGKNSWQCPWVCESGDTQKFTVQICQVATVVVETTQLVLSQFKNFVISIENWIRSLRIIIFIIIIIINEKINVAFSRRTARTRNSLKKNTSRENVVYNRTEEKK